MSSKKLVYSVNVLKTSIEIPIKKKKMGKSHGSISSKSRMYFVIECSPSHHLYTTNDFKCGPKFLSTYRYFIIYLYCYKYFFSINITVSSTK